MSPSIDMTAFDRVTDPVVRILSNEQVRRLAEYRGDDQLQARIEQLAAKSNEGELTDGERAEYAGYVYANKFVAMLQAQARRLLAGSR